jgi:PPOX class probable F420-dependent enzyme
MAVLNDRVRAALTAGRLAHLVTINPDGSPQISIVWCGVDGDEIVIGHLGEGRKVDNLRRNPRVSLSLEAEGVTGPGLANHLIIHGTARVVPGGAPALLQQLAHVYLGPDVKFPPFDNPPEGNIIRITVDRISGVGPWAD